MSLLLSDRGSRLQGLCFSLCRSSLKPNTGTRSHLPGMAQMPSTIPLPCSHKTEVGQEVMIQGEVIALDLWCLHNFRTYWLTADRERTSRHKIKAHLHLFDQNFRWILRWAMTFHKPGRPCINSHSSHQPWPQVTNYSLVTRGGCTWEYINRSRVTVVFYSSEFFPVFEFKDTRCYVCF